jgi:hypothetical protein
MFGIIPDRRSQIHQFLGNGDALCVLAVSEHPLRHHRCGRAAELEGTAARESLTGVEWR